jgi:Flp pilus assembly pilin Flp
MTTRSVFTFLHDEQGAVSVDYVVLLGAAAAAALTLLTVWDAGVDEIRSAFAQKADEEGMADGTRAGTFAAAMENYPPFHPELYDRLVADFGTLNNDDLDEMERFVNAYYAALEGEVGNNATNQGILDDLDYAMGLSYARRSRPRPNDLTAPDPEAVARIAVELGWNGQMLAEAFEGTNPVEGDFVQADPVDFGF